MARLTNRQLDILSERIVDRLQEVHEEQSKQIRESDYYVNFDKWIVEEDPKAKRIHLLLNKYIDTLKESELQAEELRDLYKESLGREYSKYRSVVGIFDDYVQYKKDKQFLGTYFNRDKMLRTIQADILLGDSVEAPEIFAELVSKYSNNKTKESNND